jgi:hypothetical protein
MMAGYMFWKGMGGGEWVEVWVQCDSRDIVRRYIYIYIYREREREREDMVNTHVRCSVGARGVGHSLTDSPDGV